MGDLDSFTRFCRCEQKERAIFPNVFLFPRIFLPKLVWINEVLGLKGVAAGDTAYLSIGWV